MIKEEYKRLLGLVEQCQDAGKVTLEEILKEAVVFFESLRKEFPKASKEHREEMIQMMTHLHARLQEVSKETAEASGMTEEELSTFAENPSNFTPEQWQVVQASRRQLYDSARKFSSALNKAEATDSKEVKKKPIKSRARRSKRKDWLQS
jgi:hypothetical protein